MHAGGLFQLISFPLTTGRGERKGSSDDVPPRDGALKPKSIRNSWCLSLRRRGCCAGPCENSERANLRTSINPSFLLQKYLAIHTVCMSSLNPLVCIKLHISSAAAGAQPHWSVGGGLADPISRLLGRLTSFTPQPHNRNG